MSLEGHLVGASYLAICMHIMSFESLLSILHVHGPGGGRVGFFQLHRTRKLVACSWPKLDEDPAFFNCQELCALLRIVRVVWASGCVAEVAGGAVPWPESGKSHRRGQTRTSH